MQTKMYDADQVLQVFMDEYTRRQARISLLSSSPCSFSLSLSLSLSLSPLHPRLSAAGVYGRVHPPAGAQGDLFFNPQIKTKTLSPKPETLNLKA